MWKLCSSFWFHPSKCEMETLMVLGKMLLEGFDPLVPSIQRKNAFLEETQAMSVFYLKQILISLGFFWFTDIHVCQKALLRGGLFMFCSQTFTSVKEHSSEEASSNFVLKHSCFPVLFTNIHLCQKALLRGVFFICGDQNHSSEK